MPKDGGDHGFAAFPSSRDLGPARLAARFSVSVPAGRFASGRFAEPFELSARYVA